MMVGCIEIQIPQIDVNNNKVVIESIQFNNLDYVQQDDILCSVATPKSVEDLVSKVNGYIIFTVEEAAEVEVGETVAYIFQNKKDAETLLRKKQAQIPETTVQATKKAVEFAEEKSIDLNAIKKHGIITRKDVQAYIDKMNN